MNNIFASCKYLLLIVLVENTYNTNILQRQTYMGTKQFPLVKFVVLTKGNPQVVTTAEFFCW